MHRDLGKFEGQTYFGAAHVAGLLVHPIDDLGPAFTSATELYYDSKLPLPEQRTQFIHTIADRMARRGEGQVEANIRALEAAILPV